MGEEEEIIRIFEDLEKRLRKRLPIAFRRSPETFLDEAAAFELAIDILKKLRQ